jgi:gliding motility-associated-like protein
LKREFYIVFALLLAGALRSAAQQGSSNIEFVENRGQWDSRVDFKGEMNIGSFFLQKTGFTVLLFNPDELKRMSQSRHGMQTLPAAGVGKTAGSAVDGGLQSGKTTLTSPDVLIHSHAYRVSFLGSTGPASVIPDKVLPGYNNYFIGRDPSKWAGNCKVYQGVTYKNIYPNIDIRYYTNNGQLKYDIIVHPGGNVDQIRMRFEGADKLNVHKNQLVVSTSVGPVRELAPYSYLFDEKGKTDVNCKYSLRDDNTVSFKVADYSPTSTLIIDPTLVFCSFTGSKVSNWGFTATPGPDGSFFAGGIVFGSAFPFTTGALQPTYGGGQFDVGIIKLNSTGSSKVYATYIGGADSETPHSMICDAQGNLVVLGRTYSTDFPFLTSAGIGGGADMFVAKLNAAGNALIGCIRIGGSGDDCVNREDQVRSHFERADTLIRNYGDDSRSEVVLDASNNILVAASSQSSAPTVAAGGFPIVGAVFQPNFGGGKQDGVILQLDPNCNHIIWSSFLGGSSEDAAFVLKPDLLTGDIYVGGATSSQNFPGNMTGVIQPGYAGGVSDGFVSIISGDGSRLKKSTYLGTSSGDAIYGLQIDKKGFPYVMGTTNGDWTVTPNVQFSNPGSKQFVSKLQPDLSAYVYSTVFGTASKLPNISPVAFLVDRCENIYVSGWGGWIIGTGQDPYGLEGTAGMPVTSDAIKRLTDNRDFYFIVLKKNASALLYGTFFGQDDNSASISEHVDGGTSRYDQNGVIYQGICANCNGGETDARYPTTPGVWATANGAGNDGCNEAAVKIAFNFAGVAAGLRVSVNGRFDDTSGCVPLNADFQDTIRNAISYIWNFGDGGGDTATTGYEVSHTYNNPGFYTVMLIALDSNSCNGSDTSYRHVIARTDRAFLDFVAMKAPGAPCTSLQYEFSNLSTAPASKPFSDSSFLWDFGDNSGQIPSGTGEIDHSFQSPGTYLVKLILVDTAYCNYPDTVSTVLRVSPLAKAQFTTPSSGCAPYLAVFNNTSLGGLQFTWDFGDGSPLSFDPNPTHEYASPGVYTVNLLEIDTTTCNKRDSTQLTIRVSGKPAAGFSFAPSPPAPNIPIVFTNGSSGGIRDEWLFGDGDSAVQAELDSTQHLYLSTGTFQACLVVYNQDACTDTVCHPVATLIDPLLDVPNAFTPGRFGENSIIKVMGFGITHMIFRIYNRWGQLVFQSSDPSLGWDGTFQGTLQPMDVYTYTVQAEFSNGAHVNKKGDITLIR